MRNYQELLSNVLHRGEYRQDRTGVGTFALFGEMLMFDLGCGFPILTTKKVRFTDIVNELIWFLTGSTNVRPLQEMGTTIWDEWADEDGELGPIYGAQWRKWGEDVYKIGEGPQVPVDQIGKLIHSIEHNPTGRRHLVTAWNPADVDDMKLPPCHYAFQCYVTNEGRLNLMWHMRSCDTFLGLPYNVTSYALLTHMLAQITGLRPGVIKVTLGDVHLYQNHVDQAHEILRRTPHTLPLLEISDKSILDIDLFKPEHFSLINYLHHPAIKAPVAV